MRLLKSVRETFFWMILQRQALHDGGLADAWFADEDRVVLLTPTQDLTHALDLGLAPDDRVEPAFFGELGHVATVVVEHGGFRLPGSALSALLTRVRSRRSPVSSSS